MNDSLIPRPFGITDAKRAREEAERRAETKTSARNATHSTIGAGGKITLDGGIDVTDGANVTVHDAGEIVVLGEGIDQLTNETIKVSCSLANRTAHNSWIGYDFLQPGLYFKSGGYGESDDATDPRVTSEDGIALRNISAVELLRNGPHVGPNIVARSDSTIGPEHASIGSGSWDDAVNPGGGDGIEGLKGSSFFFANPHSLQMAINNYDYETAPSIPQGYAISVEGTLEEGILHLYGREGVDISGPLTVDGQPVGGAVKSVAGRTGDVVLAKADVGLSSVDNTSDANKPVSNATQTALNGKASTGHTHPAATTTVAGFMSVTDKTILDAAPTKAYVDAAANAVIRGTDGKKYRAIACTVRNTGSGFEFVSDTGHTPIGVSSVTTQANTFTLNFSFTAKTVGAIVATGDEKMAEAGYIFGASVGLSTAIFSASQPGGASDYVSYNGSAWTSFSGFVTSATMNGTTGLVTCTHQAVVPAVGGTITSRSLSRHGVLDGMGATTTSFYFVDSAGTPDKTPTTNHRMWLLRAGARNVPMNELTITNSNIWIYGLMEID